MASKRILTDYSEMVTVGEDDHGDIRLSLYRVLPGTSAERADEVVLRPSQAERLAAELLAYANGDHRLPPDTIPRLGWLHVRKEDVHAGSATDRNAPFESFDVVHRRDYEQLRAELAAVTQEREQLKRDKAYYMRHSAYWHETTNSKFNTVTEERNDLQKQLMAAEALNVQLREALEQARTDIVAVNAAGFDSIRGATALGALERIDAALAVVGQTDEPRPMTEDDPK